MKNIKDKLNTSNISIDSLSYEIFDVRYTLSRMIRKLEYMYIFTTIFGSLGVGITMYNNTYPFQEIVNIVIFLATQIIFIYTIQNVGSYREGFRNIIYSRKFASKYIFARYDFCGACIELQKNPSHKPDLTPIQLNNEPDILTDSNNLNQYITQNLSNTEYNELIQIN
jgi:hypothetical protein